MKCQTWKVNLWTQFNFFQGCVNPSGPDSGLLSRSGVGMRVVYINRTPSFTLIYSEYLLILIYVLSYTCATLSTVSGCTSFWCLSSPPKSLRNRTVLFNKCLKSDNKGQSEFVGLHERGKVLLWFFISILRYWNVTQKPWISVNETFEGKKKKSWFDGRVATR